MEFLRFFYIFILFITEGSSIYLLARSLITMKEAKADGVVTKDEIKDIVIKSVIALSIGILIIIDVLRLVGIIKF